MNYEIEKGIPMPGIFKSNSKSAALRSCIKKMSVGDSVLLYSGRSERDANKGRSLLYFNARVVDPRGKKTFSTRAIKASNGSIKVRVWRVK